jgi:hypothetical protein
MEEWDNCFPFSSELFLRWGEVGRIVDIFLPPPFHFQRGIGRVFMGEEGSKFFLPFQRDCFWVAWGDGRFECF